MWVHNLDPFLWEISNGFGIRWYGLSYLAGFIFAWVLFSWMAVRQKAGLTPAMVTDFITYAAIGTMVGGRLGYCVFYQPNLFLEFKAAFPFWGVLAVNEGGMASHGGIIGLVISAMMFARKMGISQIYLLDLMSVGGPLGVAFGRIANFINGELVGRPAPADFPYSVKFPSDIYEWPSRAPSKLPELSAVVEQVGVRGSDWLSWVDQFRTNQTAREAMNSTMFKVVEEIQKGNEAARAAIAPLLEPRYPSQLIQALGEGLLTFLILFFLWRRPRRPGVIASCFVILYAIFRIVAEQFRMPDAHIGFQWLGLTRGQWLSVLMLLVGFAMLFVWGRRETLATPGWGRNKSVRLHRK
jgi:phosphatidylglycerol:prolipoprotein diacylglycerol transferase